MKKKSEEKKSKGERLEVLFLDGKKMEKIKTTYICDSITYTCTYHVKRSYSACHEEPSTEGSAELCGQA